MNDVHDGNACMREHTCVRLNCVLYWWPYSEMMIERGE